MYFRFSQAEFAAVESGLCASSILSYDGGVIFIPFVLTLEQEVIYKGLCSHEVSPCLSTRPPGLNNVWSVTHGLI